MVKPTDKQLEIRNAPELDVLVVAPAGCGKTEALALRVAGLLERRVVLGAKAGSRYYVLEPSHGQYSGTVASPLQRAAHS